MSNSSNTEGQCNKIVCREFNDSNNYNYYQTGCLTVNIVCMFVFAHHGTYLDSLLISFAGKFVCG